MESQITSWTLYSSAQPSTSHAAQPIDANEQSLRRDIEPIDYGGVIDLWCGQVVGVFVPVVLDADVTAGQQLRQVCEIELVALKPCLGRHEGFDT